MTASTIAQACRDVLIAADPAAKVKAARAAARAWCRGGLEHRFDVAMPDSPGRPDRPELLPPNRMPKRGRAGSERSRIALLHALAHIEFAAIDLAFDLVGRFGAQFPRGFVDDWIGVGADEAMHFALLDRRLRTLGAGYGDLPAHAGLWDAAAATAHDPLARLAVVPTVLEARGLDVTPATVESLERAGDGRSAAILGRIYRDEIRHVGAGMKWFRYGCESAGEEPVSLWHNLVRRHFRGAIKPPFNDSARAEAGLSREFYAGIAP
ncbi:MAG: ferritin-like domain-containing protein [Allosphingosinicella sp.]|uniref:ferritin-like domain-containing protein n=1 Tax=Allosphingosinicella sp. TaxID=2823234 RepID=UPI0039286AD2